MRTTPIATTLLAGMALCLALPGAARAGGYIKFGDIKGYETAVRDKIADKLNVEEFDITVTIDPVSDDAWKQKIRDKIADKLNVEEVDVKITISEDASSTGDNASGNGLASAVEASREHSTLQVVVEDNQGPDLRALFNQGMEEDGFDTVYVVGRAGQEARAVYYRIKLEKVHVSSYSFSAGDPAGPVPVEQISLNYETITWTYARASGGEGSR